MPFIYEYPRPSVTVDAIVLRPFAGNIEVLLIKRGRPPFEGLYAIPGGFLEMDEEPVAGVTRELLEETGLCGFSLYPVFACGQLGRDPRGRCVTMLFGALVDGRDLVPKGGDDAAEAGWFPLFSPPQTAFDHSRILEEIGANIRWQARVAVIGKNCLSKEFSADEFINLHQTVISERTTESPIDRGKRLGLIEESEKGKLLKFKTLLEKYPDWLPVIW